MNIKMAVITECYSIATQFKTFSPIVLAFFFFKSTNISKTYFKFPKEELQLTTTMKKDPLITFRGTFRMKYLSISLLFLIASANAYSK